MCPSPKTATGLFPWSRPLPDRGVYYSGCKAGTGGGLDVSYLGHYTVVLARRQSPFSSSRHDRLAALKDAGPSTERTGMALADWQRELLSYWWKDATDEDIKLIEELYGMKRPGEEDGKKL